jgi:hypothetical protein
MGYRLEILVSGVCVIGQLYDRLWFEADRANCSFSTSSLVIWSMRIPAIFVCPNSCLRFCNSGGYRPQAVPFLPIAGNDSSIHAAWAASCRAGRCPYSGSEFESGSLLRSRFVGLLGRPAVALAAYREVIPVILRLVLSEQFHENTSQQPARKHPACSAQRIRAEQQHRTST